MNGWRKARFVLWGANDWRCVQIGSELDRMAHNPGAIDPQIRLLRDRTRQISVRYLCG